MDFDVFFKVIVCFAVLFYVRNINFLLLQTTCQYQILDASYIRVSLGGGFEGPEKDCDLYKRTNYTRVSPVYQWAGLLNPSKPFQKQ